MGKKLIAVLLLLSMLLPGCSSAYKNVGMDEIVAAYEAAGYTVWVKKYDEKQDHGEIAYIQANHPDGDYIYFSFFEDEAAARANKQEFYHPVIMTLFLSIYAGELCIPRWKVYGSMVIQYENPEYYKVFRELVNEKQYG